MKRALTQRTKWLNPASIRKTNWAPPRRLGKLACGAHDLLQAIDCRVPGCLSAFADRLGLACGKDYDYVEYSAINMISIKGRHVSFACFLVAAASLFACAQPSPIFNVRSYGAVGDGKKLDTESLNKAIEACSASGGGQVLFPPGKYLSGTMRLKSNVSILLDAGAEVLGTADLTRYENFIPPKDTTLVGSRLQWHRALILGDDVENVSISGSGRINGNSITDPDGEEGTRGPHALLFGNCKNITVRDISICNSGNYAVLLEFTSDAEIHGVKITGGYDGVHFRGWKNRPCRNVSITDCEFFTGDDCIAGWYWQDALIDRCVCNSSGNGVRLFGPAKQVIIHGCLFFGPGRYAWRTFPLLNRRNMSAGICIQPSAWGDTEGAVDEVHISDAVMHDVGTPLCAVSRPPSTIGHITVDRLSATGIFRAAASFESWSKEPIGRVDVRDCSLQFVGGIGPILSDPAEAVDSLRIPTGTDASPPGENIRRLPYWGIYGRHVESLNFDDVKMNVEKQDDRPAIILDGVKNLALDGLKCPTDSRPPMVLKDVQSISGLEHSLIPVVEANCISLNASLTNKSVTATVQSGKEGLAKIELNIDGKLSTRWIWLSMKEPTDVIFRGTFGLNDNYPQMIECGGIHHLLDFPSSTKKKSEK